MLESQWEQRTGVGREGMLEMERAVKYLKSVVQIHSFTFRF